MDATYPGDGASPEEILDLAGEYVAAARHLAALGRKGKPLSYAPCRFVALHAIELYLNAFLLMTGKQHKAIRGLHHRMAERAEYAREAGLKLRQRTFAHLAVLSERREYLITRYGPGDMKTALSELNRLMATMEELAKKVVLGK